MNSVRTVLCVVVKTSRPSLGSPGSQRWFPRTGAVPRKKDASGPGIAKASISFATHYLQGHLVT